QSLVRSYPPHLMCFLFFSTDTATTEIYTLSLHDALPISSATTPSRSSGATAAVWRSAASATAGRSRSTRASTPSTSSPSTTTYRDRKSTRLNSSHSQISYAVFCLKKKNKHHNDIMNEIQR